MNRRVAFPFLTLSDSAIEAFPWSVELNGGDWCTAGDFLRDWDNSSTIRLKRTLRLDPGVASLDLGINEDELSLSLGMRLGTGPGNLPRRIIHQEHFEIDATKRQFMLEQQLDGDGLSSVLDIVTEITLTTRASLRGALSPDRVGDRLWHDRHRMRLEGEEPRFPVEIGDLRTLIGDDTAGFAPWYLHWSPGDWSRDFHGAIRLFLNHEKPEIVDGIVSQDPTALQPLLADVMGQVCERFLYDHEADESIEYCEQGSLGAQAAGWLRHGWPSRDFGYIRSMLDNRPGVFRAVILAIAEIGDD